MATGRPLVISLARYATPIRQYSVSPQSFAAWRARPSGPYLGLVLTCGISAAPCADRGGIGQEGPFFATEPDIAYGSASPHA